MPGTTRRIGTSLGAHAAVLATACGGDDPCARTACTLSACVPPFTLAVTDATGRVLPAAAAAPGLTCTAPATGLVACGAGHAEATYAVEVPAPGYAPAQVEVVVGAKPPPDACGCEVSCQSWQPRDVTLAASG